MTTITQMLRITIREFLPTEQEVYLSHFNDEKVTQYIPQRTREERISIFNTALSKYPDSKITGIWGMFGNADGAFMGSCLLRPFDDNPAILEVGYSIEQRYWGQGIATEMANAMVNHGFTDASVKEIVALTTLDNIASQRVLEKAGLIRLDNLMKDGVELAHFRLSR